MVNGRTLSPLLMAGMVALSFLSVPMALPGARGAAAQQAAPPPERETAPFSNLSAAKAALGSRVATLPVTTPQQVNDLTLPANIHLQLKGKGSISVARGKRLTINGRFSAPVAPVFAGEGEVRFGARVNLVHPEWWGGGDGKESAAAIQSAIDSIARGRVVLTQRYLLNRRVPIRLIGSSDRVDTVLVPKSNVSIIGLGERSALKVADGFTRGGDYVIFAPRDAEETSNIIFSDFKIEGNGANNLVRGMAAGQLRRAMAIWLFRGEKVRIERVLFQDHPGSNVVKLGSDHTSYLVTDSAVTGCVFDNVGGAIPGNRGQADHSTLYVSGRNVAVTGNRFGNPAPYDENGPPVAVLAAIEMHGDDMKVADNKVRNYGTGGYIVGDGIVKARNQRWTGNTFRSLTKLGISIWSVSEVAGVVIADNEIELNGALDQGVGGIFQPPQAPDTTVGIRDLTVSGNRIYGSQVKSGTVWNGIQFSALRDASIVKNTIESVSGAGILLYGNPRRDLDCREVNISGNTVRDTGFNRYGAYRYGIEIVNDGSGRFEGIKVSKNLVERTLPLATGMRGIRVQGKGVLEDIVLRSNCFPNLEREHWIDAGAKGAQVDSSDR